ncbi:response regulator transcription factor [Anaerotruncus colihominis]|uniref:response regulator transcription factor n=1 Tax=Anaerotruncus colihominis TaxID=169435 RepID=UPI0011DD1261|nr:response regulator [Anaerotruncus colihominis]
MMRVVIADDEEKVCLLIQKLVDWTAMDMEIVGVAHNGLEALELIETRRPDLMITDIRMPGCDGIELIRRARQLDPALEFIIVSGYRHFEYAQSALKYGAGDYLLKPIKKDELTATLEKMHGRWLRRTEQLSREEQMRLRLQSDLDRLRSGMFGDLLSGVRLPDGLEAFNRAYRYHMEPGNFQIFGVKVDCDEAIFSAGGFDVVEEKVAQIFRAALEGRCTEFELCFQGSRAWGVLNYRPDDAPAVRRSLRAALDQRLVEGTGRLLTAPEGGGCPAAAALAAEFGRSMQTALELLNPMMALEAIEAMRAGLENAGGYTGGELLRLTAEACGTWYLLARNLQYDVPGGDTLRERFARRADLCASADDVWCCLRGMLSEAMQVLSEQKRQADTRPIRTAKQYIQEHYADPLTLEWVSNIVGFSGSYFSSLFKKETGQNFLEYLSEVRMNRAKELLRETNLSVAEVCVRVGYSDLKYFTKSFKKATGLKPGEFRKLYS